MQLNPKLTKGFSSSRSLTPSMSFDPNSMVMMRIKQEQEYGSENLATYASDRAVKDMPDTFFGFFIGPESPWSHLGRRSECVAP